MRLDSFEAIIKAALLAGLAAGLVIAAVQFVWTEPVIDRATVLEEQLRGAEIAHSAAAAPAQGQPIVDRPTQKKGLFLGYTIYGLAYGLLFAAAYAIAQTHLPKSGRPGPAGIGPGRLQLLGSGLVALPEISGEPARVGDPDSIDFRQHLYLGLLAGGIAIVGLAFAVRTIAANRYGPIAGTAMALLFAGLASGGLYIALPDDRDVVRMPAALVTEFRLHSLAGLALFWLTLGALFAPLLGWLASTKPAMARAMLLSNEAS